jgi:hypothetical protein
MADRDKLMSTLGVSLLVLFLIVFMANRWIKKEYTKSTTINHSPDVIVPVEEARKQATAPLLTIDEGGQPAAENSDPAGSEAKKADVKKIYEIPLADPILVQ